MKKISFNVTTALVIIVIILATSIFVAAFNTWTPVKEEPKKEQDTTATRPASLINPNPGVAPIQYALLNEKLQHAARLKLVR